MAVVAGWGLWLALSSSRFIRTFTRLAGLKLNPLLPAKTDGIVGLSNLMATYSTLFALEVSLWVLPFIVITRTGVAAEMVMGSDQFQIMSVFVYVLAVLLVPAYFCYPQLAIRGMVMKQKDKILSELCTRMEGQCIGQNSTISDIRKGMCEYATMYCIVNDSPNVPLNIPPILRAVSSMALTMVITYIMNPEILTKLLDTIRSFSFR